MIIFPNQIIFQLERFYQPTPPSPKQKQRSFPYVGQIRSKQELLKEQEKPALLTMHVQCVTVLVLLY